MPIVKFMQRVTEAQGSRLGDDGLRTYFSICQHINLNYPFHFRWLRTAKTGRGSGEEKAKEQRPTDAHTARNVGGETANKRGLRRGDCGGRGPLSIPKPSLPPAAFLLQARQAALRLTSSCRGRLSAPDWEVDFRGSISSPAPIKGPKPR